jgi:tRNA(Ile)-lysidine synthase
LIQEFRTYIERLSLEKARFGVALSGGIDSVVLSELCAQAGVSFSLVHCNFGLRGDESKRDEDFVRSLAHKYNVHISVKHFDTKNYAAENKLSIQEAARNLRYNWFKELHDANVTDYILLAHHANDNIETVLMNFFRGTGIEGLTGMPAVVSSSYCLRPLLQHTRKEIEAFANTHQLQWVEDSSNELNKYTRNFFRNEIIPAIKKVYPQAEENMLHNIQRFKKINALYSTSVNALKEKICVHKDGEVHVPVLKLMQNQHTSLIYEIIKDYGFGEGGVDELIKLSKADSGRFMENENFQIIRHRNKFIISPKTTPAATIAIGKDIKEVELPGKKLVLRFADASGMQLNKSAQVAQLDAGKIEFPLIIRKWKHGDYFYPLGMRKKKKLARFFIDQKLSLADKEKIWIVESAKRIVWVIGLRIDDRFKITASSKNVLELSISSL